MPELPEVETVKRGLAQVLGKQELAIREVRLSPWPLRFPVPEAELTVVCGQRLQSIERRAKYLLFQLEQHYLLSHLGMTGSWRIETEPKKHDHVRVFLSDGRILTYNDPRRFGQFGVLPMDSVDQDPRLKVLGIDPVTDKNFTGEYLYQLTRGRKGPIKPLLMNQNLVVGVGNIYVSEALYLSSIHPLTPAYRLSKSKCELLAVAIRQVLTEAIAMGGSTISDFKQAGGSDGYFQNFLLAYGRDKEPCRVCETPIKSQMIVGRNTYWCPKCQKIR